MSTALGCLGTFLAFVIVTGVTSTVAQLLLAAIRLPGAGLLGLVVGLACGGYVTRLVWNRAGLSF